ncbi:MAG: four helix bundle protein [Bacteroidota bacterium]
MPTVKEFTELEVWRLSRDLAKMVYTDLLSVEHIKDFSLKDQMNRSSGSVMDNIAEGFGRGGNKEFRQYLSIAKGSLFELESQLYRAFDRGYINDIQLDAYRRKISTIKGKLIAFSNYLVKSDLKGWKYKVEEDAGVYVGPKDLENSDDELD